MKKTTIIYVLIMLWAVVVAWSFWSSGAVDGPRNLDVGLKRLDVFVKIQIAALSLAILSALLGFVSRGETRRLRWIGLVPLGLTVLAVAGLFLASAIFNDTGGPISTLPPKPVTQTVDN